MEEIMNINSVTLKNLRCFSEVKSLIRPITVVVGENNTGKTTFLSAYKLIHTLLYGNQLIKPNSIEDLLKTKPYQYLGGPDDILRKQSKSKEISISATLQINQDKWIIKHFIKDGKCCDKILINSPKGEIKIEIKNSNTMIYTTISNKEESITTPVDFGVNFFHIINYLLNNDERVKKDKVLHSKITTLLKSKIERTKCKLLEPIHLKPHRQYNPKDIQTTDSSYILCELAKIKQSNSWNEVSNKLKVFGKEAKLFDDLDIEIVNTDSNNSPFSIKVKVDDLESDITNVGYGVSQFLPVLGNILTADLNYHNTFLIQQPEIHLHPRVEAEFATLMVKMIDKHNKCKFICETHSDYIIKRASIEIKKQNLKPDDFLILYFESNNNETKIHEITIDNNGNLQDHPESYQEFFLKEDYSLLGLEE